MSEQTPSALGVSYVSIGEDRAGQRLDNFLIVHLKGVPKSRIYRIIRDGQVRVNKKRAKQTTRLAEGDEVRIPPIRTSEESVVPTVGRELSERLARSLIYEDKHLLVYNKPAGLAVHGGSGVSLGLIETLRALRPEELSLELVHRLDRDTSGLIMVARQRPFLRKIQDMMKHGQVTKRYWLICQGYKGKERRMDVPLLKMQHGNERVVRVSREGKESLTDFRLIERLGAYQLVEATLGTGRTHQIRVHAQYGGFPLLGDSKYGNADVNAQIAQLGINRLCLHARILQFVHPQTGETISLEAPLDDAMDHALALLRDGVDAPVLRPAGEKARSGSVDDSKRASAVRRSPGRHVPKKSSSRKADSKKPVAKASAAANKGAAVNKKAVANPFATKPKRTPAAKTTLAPKTKASEKKRR
jgi:23S rRNA pseudouridine955/2504/2580 synthase